MEQLSREAVESPPLEVSKKRQDVAPGDMGDLSVLGEWLGSVLGSFSTLKDWEGHEWLTPLSEGFWEGAVELKLWGDAWRLFQLECL